VGPEERERRVLDLVDAIPRGRVLTYGDVAELAELSTPRLVGAVLRRRGFEVPWHRVVLAGGRVAPHLASEQLARLRAEAVPISNGKVDLSRARWQPVESP